MEQRLAPTLITKVTNNNVIFGNGGQTPSGLPYLYMIGNLSGVTDMTVGIYVVTLPFEIDLHLIGVPANKPTLVSTVQLDVTMDEVNLEGDYGSYFSLFADAKQQQEARYVLDPAAMAYSVDFCKEYHWEIVNNALYFLSEEHLPSLAIVDAFINELKPAKQYSKLAPQLKIDTIALSESLASTATQLNCPVCQTSLKRGKSWLACPNGHGYLITGTQMIEVRQDSATPEKQLAAIFGRTPKVYTPVTASDHGHLICPFCKNQMAAQPFQLTSIILDVCQHCPYRWIDGTELNSVLGAYRHED